MSNSRWQPHLVDSSQIDVMLQWLMDAIRFEGAIAELVVGWAWQLITIMERLFRSTSFLQPSGSKNVVVTIVCLTLLFAFAKIFSTLLTSKSDVLITGHYPLGIQECVKISILFLFSTLLTTPGHRLLSHSAP